MRLITPEIEISEDEPFKNDVLDRANYAQALTNLIVNSDDSLVISVNAPWGEGKTTFAKMWSASLKNNGVHSIYFDAFEHDFLEDAFIPIVSEITAYFENLDTEQPASNLAEFRGKAAKVGGRLLAWTAKVGVKAATLGILKDADLDELQDIQKDIAKDASTLVSDFVHERIMAHEEEKQTLVSFKELLSSLPSLINDLESSRLVIVIDELDRCKPTFALQVIERIKHILSVPNVVFVLMMHSEQLEESVRCVYGGGIDARTYLQKFITIDTDLPKRAKPEGFSDKSHYEAYIHSLFTLHGLEIFDQQDEQSMLIYYIAMLSEKFGLSLRQMQKVLTNVAVFYGSISENSMRFPEIVGFLAVIRLLDRKVFEGLSTGEIDADALFERFPVLNVYKSDEQESRLRNLVDGVKFCTLSKQAYDEIDDTDELKRYYPTMTRYHVEREFVMPYHCRMMSIVKVNQ